MRSPFRVLRMLAAVVLGTLCVVPAQAGQAAIPAYTLEERAEAIARPALVLVEVRAKGFVRNKVSGELVSADQLTMYNRCSGFIVSTEGYMITVDHCAQPSEGAWRGIAYSVLADRMIAEKKLANDQRAAFIADLNANATLTGADPNQQPEIKLFVQHNSVQGGQASVPGEVLATRPALNENLALVKLAVGGLPAVEIETTPVGADGRLTLLGYANVTNSTTDTTYAPRSKEAKVAKLATEPAGPSRLDADLGGQSHGGMAVDQRGKAVGMINLERAVKDQPRRLLVPGENVKNLLDAQNVVNKLGPTDLAYRAALDSYFAGRYSQAISSFDTVLKAVPDHQLAANYRKQAADRLAIEGDVREAESGPGMVSLIVAAVLGAVLVVVIVFVIGMMRRRRRVLQPRSREVFGELTASPFAPVSAVPVSVYPVSDPGYSQPDPDQRWDPFAIPQGDAGYDTGYPASGESVWGPPAPGQSPDVQNGR